MKCDQCGHEFETSDPNPVCPVCGSSMVFTTGATTGHTDNDETLPWENRKSILDIDAIFKTIKAILLEPSQTFAHMKTAGDMTSPTYYFLLLGSIGMVVGQAWSILLESFTGSSESQEINLIVFSA